MLEEIKLDELTEEEQIESRGGENCALPCSSICGDKGNDTAYLENRHY